jgi:hypothetical protein
MHAIFQSACACVLLSGALAAAAQAPPPGTATTRDGDYDVRRWQVKQNAPADSVGVITTDYEIREGAEHTEAWGNSRRSTLTVGGFVKRCPTADGKALGSFEYTLRVEEVETGQGETQRRNFTRGFRATRMAGEVGDDAQLKRIDVDGTLTRGDGSAPQQVHMSFAPDQSGQPDWDAMRRAVALTQDLSLATLIWFAAPTYRDAQVSWFDKRHACLEFEFDPPTRTVMLAPGESKVVRVGIKTKSSGSLVPRAILEASARSGEGRLAPPSDRSVKSLPMSYTYTASATPKPGHGFEVAAISLAGVAFDEKWQIDEQARFEGTFSQLEKSAIPGAGYGILATSNYKTDGRLVWTPEPDSGRAPTFGEVASKFYAVTDGEFTIKIISEGKSIAGSCVHEGTRTFAVRSLPPAALKLLQLEVAADGRYRIMLRMLSKYLQFQVTRNCSVQAAPGFPIALPGGGGGTEIVNDASISLGKHEGTVVDDTVAGRTAAPIVTGPFSVTGEWKFKKISQARR